jgi:hypothetical protein
MHAKMTYRSDVEGQALEHVVDELDGHLLIEAVVDPEDAQPRAVVDGGELEVLLARAGDRGDELDVDLNPVPGLRLLIPLPALGVAFVALRGRQPTQIQALEDSPDTRHADLDVVVALEVHGNLLRPEVVVLTEVENLADCLVRSGARADVGTAGSVAQPVHAEPVEAALPFVEDLPRDAVIPAGQGDVVADLLGVSNDGKTLGYVPG